MAISTGALFNAIGILVGAMIGLAQTTPFSLRAQLWFRNAIGFFNIFYSLRLIYLSFDETFALSFRQVCVGLLAILLGFWVGKLFRFQKMSNYVGRIAGKVITAANNKTSHNAADGFNACAILFCAAPLGLVGAVTDGLSDYFYLLAVKAVMDALAMSGFVRIFRWPTALSAIPVFIFFSAISLAVQLYVKPYLTTPEVNAVNMAVGLLGCIITIVIFEVRRVELANYLPALVVAPLLTKWFG